MVRIAQIGNISNSKDNLKAALAARWRSTAPVPLIYDNTIINTGMERSENGNSSTIRVMVELFTIFCNSNHFHHTLKMINSKTSPVVIRIVGYRQP